MSTNRLLALALVLLSGYTSAPSQPPIVNPPPVDLAPVDLAPECAGRDQGGTDFEIAINSTILAITEQVAVHLAGCAEDSREPLPILYLLHGAAADETQWPDVDILVAIDAAVAHSTFPPVAVVMPDAATAYRCGECIGGLTAHLLAEIEPQVAAIAPIDPGRRSIGGISRGGAFALSVAAQSPREFVAIGAHSPVAVPDEALIAVSLQEVCIYLDVGLVTGW